MPNPTLMQAVLALINAESEAERKRVLESQRDVLLTDDAEQLLNDWLAQSQDDDARTLQECLDLLVRCRKEGIAFVEYSPQQLFEDVWAFIDAYTWAGRKRIVEERRDLLLSDEADQVFADLLEQYQSNANTIRVLQEYRTLLARCREEGIDAAFTERVRPSPSAAKIRKALFALVEVKNPSQQREIIEREQAVLLTDAADKFLATLIENMEDFEEDDVIRNLRDCRTLLANCRNEGIDAAFAKAKPSTSPSSPQPETDLLALLNEIDHLTRPSEMPRRVELCREALKLVKREDDPKRWASLQNKLANSLRQNPLGSQSYNIEHSIAHYKLALEVYSQKAAPHDWAMTQNNLANAYRNRIRGVRADNIEQAIVHYKLALEVYSQKVAPHQWATTINHLALAYSNRIRGVRADNIEQAIAHYKLALEVYSQKTAPHDWAGTMNNLAIAYNKRIRGERADNIEQAIAHYKLALEVDTQKAVPHDWAGTMNNLAAAYRNRIRGVRADNIEQAIAHYKLALEVYTQKATPHQWAMTMNNLAIAYYSRIRGVRADNIEQAIAHYKLALEIYTQKATPHQWATTINHLAAAYSERIRGVRADNIEQAIAHYKLALEVHSQKAAPHQWATTINHLAGAYSSRIRGERADNLEQAIAHYKLALEVRTQKAAPHDWAGTMNNLANALRERIRGVRADNIEEAIAHLKLALEVYSQKAAPHQWATTQNNLANALRERIRGERADNIEQTIAHLKLALEVYSQKAAPHDWAMTQNNLALAYSERIRGVRADNIEQAIMHLKLALEVYTQKAAPHHWATTQNNLAGAYSSRIRGERADNLEQAIFHAKLALEVDTPQSFPQNCREAAYGLGRLLYDERRFAEARQVFVKAHEAVEALRGEMVREGARRELAEENAGLYARLVFCCLHDGDEEAAFEYAAAGKGRVFADLLASARFDLSAVGDNDPAFAADWQTHREFRQQIENLLVELTEDKGIIGTSGGPTGSESRENERRSKSVLYDELRATQKEAAEHWEEMTFRYPALTACESTPTLNAQDARELSAQLGATLVEYYRHAAGWCAFVVTPSEVRYVALPAVDELIELMHKWTKRIEKRIGRNKASYRRLLKWYETIIAPLNLPKGEANAVVLAPFGALHLLPLTAARHPQSKRYVSEQHTLAFVPSLGALSVAVKESRKGQSLPTSWKQALLVAYPGQPPLDHVVPEAQAIANYFPEPMPLHKEAATPDEVVKEARGKEVIHFGCHGWFDSQQPEQSGLMLADGWLTVQRIITDLRLKQCQLTTLGACQSGRTALGSGDEHVGLIQALMTAGTPSVVASLWSVNDTATRALFEHFYAEITKGQPPAIALRQAAKQVRKRSGWEHPYYWGAFSVSGLAHGPVRPALSLNQAAAPKVAKPLDTINQESKRQRGSITMNEKDIYDEAIDLLEQISEDADYFASEIGSTDGAIVVQRLTALRKQAATTESESQLLALCDSIHKLAEEMPALRDLLILKSSDVDQMQKDRFFTIEGFNKTSAQQQADSKALGTLQQQLTKTQKKLEAHIKRLEELQAENEANRPVSCS